MVGVLGPSAGELAARSGATAVARGKTCSARLLHTLNHIGDAQRNVGDLDAARNTLEQALRLAQKLPDKAYAQAQIRGNLGGVY